jgi:hypothetical protein
MPQWSSENFNGFPTAYYQPSTYYAKPKIPIGINPIPDPRRYNQGDPIPVFAERAF